MTMKKFIIKMLQRRAKAVLGKFNPTVVAVTGSFGKTTTKEAMKIVLSQKFSVRSGKENYNNEMGVPFAILGVRSPGKSIMGWLNIFRKSYQMKSYPEVLVLEFGADHPGDISALCELAPPKIGVVTGVSPVHAEFFENVEALAAEKASLVESLPEDGVAILNADDVRVAKMHNNSMAKNVTYGLKSEELSAANVSISTRIDESFEPGETFAVTLAEVREHDHPVAQLTLRNNLGYAPVMACLAAIQVGSALGVSIRDAVEALNKELGPQAGRLRPIAGIKGSLIVDDSYNAAPAAMVNGLEILRLFEPGEEYDRRIAALGSMAELGQYSENEHRLIGMRVAESADVFVAVGENMKSAVEAAREAGMDHDRVEWFATSKEAGRYLDANVQQGDVVYVKGSQSSRMEHVVKDLMAEPLRAAELLVRQGPEWQK